MSDARPLEPGTNQALYTRSSTSAASFSSLPEVVGHGQVKANAEQTLSNSEKEVAGENEKEPVEDFAYGLPPSPRYSVRRYSTNGLSTVSKSRSTKLLWWICAGITVFLLIGVGLGVGLGIGLRPKQPDTKSSTSAHKSSPTFLSTRGAFNGTGIALVRPQVLSNLTSGQLEQVPYDKGEFQLFFQHHTGEIRWMEHSPPSFWSGGSFNDVVATDAKNGTPITALETNPEGTQEWHVFYVNKDNLVRQRSLDNITYVWTDGPLNDMNLKTLDADKIGLQVTWYGGTISNVDLNGTDHMTGMRLFVATSETTFDQLAWRSGLPQWIWEQSWPNQNGHANPACYSWAKGTTTYVMFVDLDNKINMYWRDSSVKELSTSAHPINTWTLSKDVVIQHVDPNPGLSFRANLYARMIEDDTMRGWNISFAAENSTIVPSNVSTVEGDPSVSTTHLMAWADPPAQDIENALLFYQTRGDDITMYTGSLSSGKWSSTVLPIPDE